MGCVFSKRPNIVEYSYRKEIGNPLIVSLLPNLPSDTQVIVIRLQRIVDLPFPPTNISGSADPYVEMKLTPDDSVAGEQFQRSSVKPATTNPKWFPDERFQFIISSDIISKKIVFSVLSYRHALGPSPLADAVLNLKDIKGNIRNKTLKLISPTTGKHCGTAHLDIECLTLAEASSVQEQTVFEYQRWQPAVLWGSTSPGHLLPTDPGKWSTVDGGDYSSDIDDILQLPGDGWSIQSPLKMLASDDDPDGWQYATNFRDLNWHASTQTGLMVRKRAWRRVLTKLLP